MKYFYLMENCNIGLAYPDAYELLAFSSFTWLSEKELAKQILEKIGMEFKDEILEFSAGSMFWAKTDAIKQLLDLDLTWDDFGKDKKQVGGTLEYVFERIPGVVARNNNYDIAILNEPRNIFYLNNGNKSLDRYSLWNENSVMPSLSNFDIVSFDIFDTLITRKIANPEDVFLLIQKKLENLNINLINYAILRKKAKLKADEKKNFETEVTLDEIYDELKELSGISDKDLQAIKELEINTELELCIPKKEVLNVFNELKKIGKQIILVSDMYFSKDVIEKILKKCGYFGYNELLVSSEVGLKKSNGKMWEYFISKYGESKTIHIGDNEVSDVHILADMGKTTLYFAPSKRLLQLSDYNIEHEKFDLANSVLFGCIYNKSLFNSPFALRNIENEPIIKSYLDFGYSIIGPVILNYMIQLINLVKPNAESQILIFDYGQLNYFRRIYDYLKEKLEIDELNKIQEYDLLISKRATLAFNIQSKEDLYSIFDKEYKGTLKEILYYKIGFIKSDLNDKIIELPRDIDHVKAVIDDNYEIIISQLNVEKENYIKYVNSLLLNVHDKTLNFVSNGDKEEKRLEVDSLSKIIDKKIQVRPLLVNSEYEILLKTFFDSTTKNLRCIDENLEPHYNFSNKENLDGYLEEVYLGVIKLIDDVVDIYGKDIIDAKLNEKVIENNLKGFKREMKKLSPAMKKIFNVENIDEI